MNTVMKTYFDVDMHTRPATKIAAWLFMIAALVHLLRVLFGWSVTVGAAMVPMWVSVIVIPVGLILAFLLMREAHT
jgi:hypothetical protein